MKLACASNWELLLVGGGIVEEVKQCTHLLLQILAKAKVLSSSQRDMVTATVYYVNRSGFPKVPDRRFDAHECG